MAIGASCFERAVAWPDPQMDCCTRKAQEEAQRESAQRQAAMQVNSICCLNMCGKIPVARMQACSKVHGTSEFDQVTKQSDIRCEI